MLGAVGSTRCSILEVQHRLVSRAAMGRSLRLLLRTLRGARFGLCPIRSECQAAPPFSSRIFANSIWRCSTARCSSGGLSLHPLFGSLPLSKRRLRSRWWPAMIAEQSSVAVWQPAQIMQHGAVGSIVRTAELDDVGMILFDQNGDLRATGQIQQCRVAADWNEQVPTPAEAALGMLSTDGGATRQ